MVDVKTTLLLTQSRNSDFATVLAAGAGGGAGAGAVCVMIATFLVRARPSRALPAPSCVVRG